MDQIELWEVHRGGGREMPESSPLSFEYGWLLGGRPEADVRTSADGILFSIHDSTLDRIVRNLPRELAGQPVSALTGEQIRSCEVGNGEIPQRIPSLEELFGHLKIHPERHLILDFKQADLSTLAHLIRNKGVERQLTFASCDSELCRKMKQFVPEIRTKNWLGGSPESIRNSFRKLKQENFREITEVQIHLRDAEAQQQWRYQISPEFLREALECTRKKGVLLQVLPWEFGRKEILELLKIGIRSFAVDFPSAFLQICAEYFAETWRTQE